MSGKINDVVSNVIETTPVPENITTPEGLTQFKGDLDEALNSQLETSFATWTNSAGETVALDSLPGASDNMAKNAAEEISGGAADDAGSILADLIL
jgi:hypothetical protein